MLLILPWWPYMQVDMQNLGGMEIDEDNIKITRDDFDRALAEVAGAYTRPLFGSTRDVSVTHAAQRIIKLNKRGLKHVGG